MLNHTPLKWHYAHVDAAEDRELAKRAAAGDRAASLRFFQTYHVSVFRYTSSLVASPEDAEDLAAEAIVEAHTMLGSYRAGSSLRTWVHRIAFHTYTHWKRRQRRHVRLDDDVCDAHSPFAAVDEAEALTRAIARLPETLSQPFVLSQINELSMEEVGFILGIPPGTVKSRLHYARAQLRELLDPPMELTNVQQPIDSRRTH
ncbi:MAG: RNA polymerase sigma factor [Fimbriimonas sp.]|nr:RNA polymerase sigma factor [Fimbriimonas sp.]